MFVQKNSPSSEVLSSKKLILSQIAIFQTTKEHTMGDENGSHLVTNRISFTLSSAGCFDPKKAFRQTTRQTIEVCENLFEIE